MPMCYQSISNRWAGALTLIRPFRRGKVSIFKVQEQSLQTAASFFFPSTKSTGCASKLDPEGFMAF